MATFGTQGDDNLSYATANSPLEVYGLAGNDKIQGGNNSDYLNGGSGDDTLSGSVGNDVLVGEDGNDVLYANVGEDQLFGGAGNDVLNGSEQNNILDGSSGDDGINGYGGDDTIDAGTGRDIVYAGDGNDRITVDGSFADGFDIIDGGGGNDVFVLSGLNFSLVDSWGQDRIEISLSFSLAGYGAIEDLTLTGGLAINGYGNDLANTIGGNGAGNVLDGGGGNDLIRGYGGNDTITGGLGGGIEYLYGGTGDDTFFVLDDQDRPVEFGNEGRDTVRSEVRFVLGENLEDLVLTGAANVNGFGNALANTMMGNTGNNYLDGGLGLDALAGGVGNDYYALGDATSVAGAFTWDTVTEGTNGGIDTVAASADVGRYTYQLTANVENLVAVGVSSFRLWGNDLGNSLTGNSAANEIAGYGGDDSMDGRGGYDVVAGGAGSDTYILDDINRPNDFFLYQFDSVTEAYGEGLDTVRVKSQSSPDRVSTFGYTLTANVENGVITGTDAFNLSGNDLANTLTGNGVSNVLTGNGGNDRLTGGLGADILRGGAGDDAYFITDLSVAGQFTGFVYDTVTEVAAEGNDTVFVSALDDPDTFTSVERYTLGANIENGVIEGSLAFDLSGNELANTLTGNSAVNSLKGFDGNDVLNGGFGADAMTGGLGNDTFVVDHAGDKVIELNETGIDTINASVSFSLTGTYVEKLVLTGSANINAIGNGLANTLLGNTGINILVGGTGNDVMAGRFGNDVFLFNSALSATTNADRITDFANVSGNNDSIRLENAVFTAFTATGVLAAGAFAANTTGAATQADDRIIYETDTGKLFYDADGSGATNVSGVWFATLSNFATLTGASALTAADFFVV